MISDHYRFLCLHTSDMTRNFNIESKNPLRLLAICLFILLLIINPGIYLETDPIYLDPKDITLKYLILPSSVYAIYLARRAMPPGIALRLLLLLGIWLILLFILTKFSSELWIGPSNRRDGVFSHLIYISVALAGLFVVSSDTKLSQRNYRYLSVAAVAASLFAVSQQLGLLGVPGMDLPGTSATVAGGTLGNRGYMGGALALLLPLSICLARNRPSLWSYLGLIIVTWGLSATVTRGAWIAGLAGVCVLWVTRQLTLKVILLLSAGIALSLAPAFFLPDAPMRSFSGSSSAAILTNNSGRTVLYRSALIGIAERPLLGWGGNALWKVMAERSDQELLAEGEAPAHVRAERRDFGVNAPPSFILTLPTGEKQWFVLPVNKVHNEYLDYALTYGIPAAVLFTLLLGYGIWNAWTTAPVLSACLVAYGVYLLTWPEVIRFAPIAWFLLGLALAQRRDVTVET